MGPVHKLPAKHHYAGGKVVTTAVSREQKTNNAITNVRLHGMTHTRAR